MSVVDKNFLSASTWGTHTQADGSDIGGVPPDVYQYFQSLPVATDSMLMYASSAAKTACPMWMAHILRPWETNTGKLNFSFSLSVDENAASYAQAIETDIIISDGEYNYNMSLQNDYSKGGVIEIAGQNGNWVETGLKPGKFSPFVKHAYSINYGFNTTTHKFGVTSISIDGDVYEVPTSLQDLTAVKKGWAKGANVQLQQDIIEAGGKYQLLFESMVLTWS